MGRHEVISPASRRPRPPAVPPPHGRSRAPYRGGFGVRLGPIDLTTELRSQAVSDFYHRAMPITVGIRL